MNKKNHRERIKEIVSVFIKYGIKEGIKTVNDPAQVRMALEELGPTFIKIGQILSTRPDILPESYIREFQKLQDDVKPESFDNVKAIVESQLGRKMEDVFSTFERKPTASASLAQVHCAVLKDGGRVAVKVLRPKVRESMLSDISILRRLAVFLKLAPQGHVMNPREVAEELMEAAKHELDFLYEAQNINKFHEYNMHIKYIKTPKVYDEYTTSDILVMEYIEGIKIAETSRLEEEGYELKDISAKLVANYIKQIFEDGFFHADPHPGNILITGNKIAFVDFGMMGCISKSIRGKFNTFLKGLAERNIDLITKTILKIGVKKGNVNIKKLHSDVEQIYNNYVEESFYNIELTEMLDEMFTAEHVFKLIGFIKMVFDSPFPTPCYNYYIFNPGIYCFLNNILDCRCVYYGQHFLWLGFCGR
jgi:ubiquinone biosynthesis protein